MTLYEAMDSVGISRNTLTVLVYEGIIPRKYSQDGDILAVEDVDAVRYLYRYRDKAWKLRLYMDALRNIPWSRAVYVCRLPEVPNYQWLSLQETCTLLDVCIMSLRHYRYQGILNTKMLDGRIVVPARQAWMFKYMWSCAHQMYMGRPMLVVRAIKANNMEERKRLYKEWDQLIVDWPELKKEVVRLTKELNKNE